jgi:hypothetical protein
VEESCTSLSDFYLKVFSGA